MYSKIEKCRICDNTQLVEVLDLGVQALTGVFPKSKDQQITKGPLKLVKCTGPGDVCGLLQLQHTYSLGELYGDNYGYRSGLNASMVAHLKAKVAKILVRGTLPQGALVIDIGSNDSTTLQAYPSSGLRLVGIDPTGKKFSHYYPKHIELIPEFFSAAGVKSHLGNLKASVITSFSMFYDLERPMSFMQEVGEALDEEGIWVFEQSYMPTMLLRNSYDTACHEHLEYYALRQIKWMADRVGLKIIDVEFNDVNGGSFSIVASKQGSSHKPTAVVESILKQEVERGLETLEPYRQFALRVANSKKAVRTFLADARKAGKRIGVLGASTKGNVLLQYCAITEDDVECVGEVNADKFGCYTPGSLLPIISENEMLAMGLDYLLVLPWHFRTYFEQSGKFADRNLVFPLPELDVVGCNGH